MNRIFHFALLPLFFCLVVSLSAGGKKETKNTATQEEKGAKVRVTGTVRLVGNEPFSEIVITGQEAEWYIDREETKPLKELQHRTVTVEGAETVTELVFANGRSAGERRTLKNIRILEIR